MNSGKINHAVCLFALVVASSMAGASEIQKFVANDASTLGWFGISVSLDQGTALIGANPLANAGGIFGVGSVYVFENDGMSGWQQAAKLQPNNSYVGDRFGDDVDLAGNFAIVGSPTGEGSPTRIGSAYIFERTSPGSWHQVARLESPTPFSFDSFGSQVSIEGHTAVVGAAGDGSSIGKVGGSAYVYRLDSTGQWRHIASLQAADTESSDGFGYRGVAISGNKIVVGAYLDDNVGRESGSAYIFEEDGAGNWNQTAKLIASDAGDLNWFGWSVDISGDSAVIGSMMDGAYGDRSGAAYIFDKNALGEWVQTAKLVSNKGVAGLGMGGTVSISGDVAVVGALTSEAGENSGSAFVFHRDTNGTWIQLHKLVGSDTAAGDHFGSSVSAAGNMVLAGAWVDDHIGGIDAGSAYLFELTIPEPSCGLLASLGFAMLCPGVRMRILERPSHTERSSQAFVPMIPRDPDL